MAYLIDKNGNEVEINYYELGDKLKEIIDNLSEEGKRDYQEFASNYKNFYPDFDYAILRLGYSIKEPYGKDTLINSEEGKMYYYHPDIRDKDRIIKERLYQMNRINIKQVSYNVDEMESGIMDRNGNYFNLEGITAVHTTLPVMLVNYTVIRNKEIYEEFINYDMDFSKEMCFLEDYLGYVRISFDQNRKFATLTFSGSMLTDKEKDYIEFLKETGYTDDAFAIDKDKNSFYQSKVHRDK